MRLGISSRKSDDNVTVIALAGDLVASTMVDNVEERVGQILASGSDRVVFDLSDLTSMDSAGVGLMVFSFATMRDVGGVMCLAAPGKNVKKVLHFTRLDSFLSVCDSVEEAIRQARTEPPVQRTH